MSNYIPHYTKKQSILDRKERDLVRTMERGEDELAVFRAALAVRDARVRALKAQYETIPQRGENEERCNAVKTRIRLAEATSAESVIAEFKSRLEKGDKPPTE